MKYIFLSLYLYQTKESLSYFIQLYFVVVQLPSCVWLSGTPWLQQSRLPCPALSPGVFSNPCPLSWWCHPTTSHSDAPFSSCPQSFRASGSFPMSWLLPSGGQSIETSALVLPMNIQDWFPLGLTDLIPLLSKGLSRVFFSTKLWKHQFFSAQPSLWSNSHIHMSI